MILGGTAASSGSGKPSRPRPLAAALDRAIREENALALAQEPRPDAEARAAADAARWTAIRAAQEAAGEHAVVLPIATVRDALEYLREHPEADVEVDLLAPRQEGRPLLPAELLIRMIEAAFPDRLT